MYSPAISGSRLIGRTELTVLIPGHSASTTRYPPGIQRSHFPGAFSQHTVDFNLMIRNLCMTVIAERKCVSAGVAGISIAQLSTHGHQSIGSGDAHPSKHKSRTTEFG